MQVLVDKVAVWIFGREVVWFEIVNKVGGNCVKCALVYREVYVMIMVL